MAEESPMFTVAVEAGAKLFFYFNCSLIRSRMLFKKNPKMELLVASIRLRGSSGARVTRRKMFDGGS